MGFDLSTRLLAEIGIDEYDDLTTLFHMGMKTDSLDQWNVLLQKFSDLGRLQRTPKTLLEIAKRQNHELVHSNLLAFFLDPQGEHGLGDVFLKALFKATNSHLAVSNDDRVEVIVEDPTQTRKRIDIVVQAGRFLVGIENKITAKVSNPLDKYAERLKERADERRIPRANILKLLLSTKSEHPQHGFEPLTYETFFLVLEKMLPDENTQNATGRRYAEEFMKTIKNLKKTTHLDPRFLQLVAKKQKAAVSFYLECEKLLAEMNQKADQVMEGLQLPPDYDSPWTDRKPREPFSFFFSTISSTVEVEPGLKLCAQADLHLAGWELSVYSWRDKPAPEWLGKINKEQPSLDYNAPAQEVQHAYMAMCSSIIKEMKRRRN